MGRSGLFLLRVVRYWASGNSGSGACSGPARSRDRAGGSAGPPVTLESRPFTRWSTRLAHVATVGRFDARRWVLVMWLLCHVLERHSLSSNSVALQTAVDLLHTQEVAGSIPAPPTSRLQPSSGPATPGPALAQGRPSGQDGCPLDGWGDHARRPGALGRGLPRLPCPLRRPARPAGIPPAGGRAPAGPARPVERENGWQVAEAVGEATPGRRQRLLSRVDWEMDAARDRRRAFGCETFGDPEGIGILDEAGFLRSVAERGDRAGPGRGPALAELVPPPHPVPAGPCLAGLDPKPGRGGASRGGPFGPGQGRPRCAGCCRCPLAGARRGRGGDEPSAGEPGTAATGAFQGRHQSS
jgi:hypothetical protein